MYGYACQVLKTLLLGILVVLHIFSVIVSDFSSPESLSQFVLDVDNDDKRYLTYLEYKQVPGDPRVTAHSLYLDGSGSNSMQFVYQLLILLGFRTTIACPKQ